MVLTEGIPPWDHSTIGRTLQKGGLRPHLKQRWTIPPHANGELVARMEDVLEVYHRRSDPVVSVAHGEKPYQLLGRAARRPPRCRSSGELGSDRAAGGRRQAAGGGEGVGCAMVVGAVRTSRWRATRPRYASPMPRPVVLDVDTGVDDACAVLFAAAHPDLDLRAVTCVGGNAGLDDVVRNTMTVLDAAGRTDVPVARGAARPLLEEPVDARHVHGQDGMGDLDWPRSTRPTDPRHAVELLRDVFVGAADDPVTLVTLAPMTNIALLLRTFPEVARGIREIVFMGGAAAVGNATASAEFNIVHDPEAAAITLDAAAALGIPLTMYGLDVFYEPRVTRGQAATLVASGYARAVLPGRLIEFQCQRLDSDSATIGDAGAVCAVVDRQALLTQRLPVRIELGGSWSRGRTVVDRRSWAGDMSHDPHGLAPVTVDVALAVDGPRYASLWLEVVSSP